MSKHFIACVAHKRDILIKRVIKRILALEFDIFLVSLAFVFHKQQQGVCILNVMRVSLSTNGTKFFKQKVHNLILKLSLAFALFNT